MSHIRTHPGKGELMGKQSKDSNPSRGRGKGPSIVMHLDQVVVESMVHRPKHPNKKMHACKCIMKLRTMDI